MKIHTVADYKNRKLYLLALICGYTPTEQDREGILDLVEEMEEDGREQVTIIHSLVTILWDGLTYGNWPWSVR